MKRSLFCGANLMEQKKNDQRRCHRIRINLEATVRESKEDRFPVMALIVDMSALGLCITTPHLFTIKQKLYVTFEIPEDRRVTVETEVVHHQNIFRYGEVTNQYGLKIFDDMREDEREFLKFFAKEFLKAKSN